eukprot:CAMPEP_0176427462 /NCGR_PEP_ID=MMETSP0127-20121128/12579_1 /TAXON_ID=938130 /ORGANISM="Platyophrya macrostoma, Strain WH" /LENGTH=471 /DNA_ID=CAMNT_0017808979 /DNA_START=651 /DNA_END=2066 /DNA_ORIENTATION=-
MKEKEAYLLVFSHEFRNALNGLLGSLQLLSDFIVDSKLKSLLSSANVCGTVLRTITQNLLDAGKYEVEKLETACSNTDLGEFLTNFWQVAAELIKNKNLRGFVKINKNIPANLMIDNQKLLQVLLNLTSNSIKFTDEGHIYFVIDWVSSQEKIRFSSESNSKTIHPSLLELNETEEHDGREEPIQMPKQTSKFFSSNFYHLNFEKRSLQANEALSKEWKAGINGYLKISVVDSGIGMEEEDKNRLFRKFSQVSDDPNRRSQGTGLGLWITHELVKMMGGTINVTTMKGKGTIFEVSIKAPTSSSPLLSSISNADRNERINEKFKSKSENYSEKVDPFNLDLERPLLREKVLIADDDCFNLKILQDFLSKIGKEVITARNGQELFENFKIHSHNITAVITDNYMPRKSGFDAAKQINQHIQTQGLAKIPIILLTGEEKSLISKQALEDCGITEVLLKPIDFKIISKLFEKRS